MTPFVLSMAVAIAATVAVAIPFQEKGETTFKLLSSRSGLNDPRTDIPEMEVTFGNGQKDTMVLRHYNAFPDSTNIDHTTLCNYLGHLKYEQDARVAVTGCVDERNLDGKMYITLLSSRSLYQKSFSMDLDGNVEPINIMESNDAYLVIPEDGITRQRDSDEFNDGDDIGSYKVEAEAAAAETTGVPIPKDLIVKIKIGTDTSAKNTIEKLGKTVDNWLSEVFTHVQNHYYHPTLGHRLKFEIVGDPMRYWDTGVPDEYHLKKLSEKTYDDNNDNIALYAWVCDGNKGQGAMTTGLAYLGSACDRGSSRGRSSKTSVTQGPSRQNAIVETAETLAHEMGHNLGMSHDFYSNKKQCKKEEDGSKTACYNCKNWTGSKLKKVTNWDNPGKSNNPGECCTGFMDYDDHPEYWSDCSVRNFEQHYVSQKWAKCMSAGYGGGPAWDPNLSTSICEDDVGNPNCQKIGTGGYGDCDGNNAAIFQKVCKKTCGLCGTSPAAPSTGGGGSNSNPTTTTGICEDEQPANCKLIGKVGYGDCNSGGNVAVFQRVCKKSCGICGTSPAAPSGCDASTQFTCNNNKCIQKSYKCDGYKDCTDDSDEQNCGTTCEDKITYCSSYSCGQFWQNDSDCMKTCKKC